MTQNLDGPRDLTWADNAALYDGILSKRVVAFFVDAIFIVLLMIPAAILLFVLAIVTLGIAFFLYPALFAIVALGYVALTLGGPSSATPGMRMVGIEARTGIGRKMFPLLAAMHAVIFWASVTLLTPLILLIGLVTPRNRLLHDIVLDVVLVNSHAAPKVV